jgi:hypothetical protein
MGRMEHFQSASKNWCRIEMGNAATLFYSAWNK